MADAVCTRLNAIPDRPKKFRPLGMPEKPKDTRPSAARRGYGYRWDKARKRYLATHPLCVYCKRRGRVKAATCVDHVVPHKSDLGLFWDVSNWQSLCGSCHSRKTVTEDGGFGR